MTSLRGFVYRSWSYFRNGFSIYIAFPLSLISFGTTTFYLLINNIPVLKELFPSFTIFFLLALCAIIPLGVLIGYIHQKRTQIYGTDQILAAECNPIAAYSNRVSYEYSIKVYESLGIKPGDDILSIYNYWKKLDDKWKWRPT